MKTTVLMCFAAAALFAWLSGAQLFDFVAYLAISLTVGSALFASVRIGRAVFRGVSVPLALMLVGYGFLAAALGLVTNGAFDVWASMECGAAIGLGSSALQMVRGLRKKKVR